MLDIAKLRREYPHGATVELLEMNDPYREMPAGLRGVVDLIDDAGGIHINWQNGSSLAAIPGRRSDQARSCLPTLRRRIQRRAGHQPRCFG